MKQRQLCPSRAKTIDYGPCPYGAFHPNRVFSSIDPPKGAMPMPTSPPQDRSVEPMAQAGDVAVAAA